MYYLQVLEELPVWKTILFLIIRFRFKDAYHVWQFFRNPLKVGYDPEKDFEVYYPDFEEDER